MNNYNKRKSFYQKPVVLSMNTSESTNKGITITEDHDTKLWSIRISYINYLIEGLTFDQLTHLAWTLSVTVEDKLRTSSALIVDECPYGHVHTSDCRRSGCPCVEEHDDADFEQDTEETRERMREAAI